MLGLKACATTPNTSFKIANDFIYFRSTLQIVHAPLGLNEQCIEEENIRIKSLGGNELQAYFSANFDK